MRGLEFLVVTMFVLLIFPAVGLSGTSQEDVVLPFWNSAWSSRQEVTLPIPTNDSLSHYQPIDQRITFEKLCWTADENHTSIRVCCWYFEEWHELESQIYSITKESEGSKYITACNIIFLIPAFADGTERYFIYYNEGETPKPGYTDHVRVEDSYYSSSPSPDISAQAKFYGVMEDGFCVYGVGQEGQLIDRPCAQVVVKQKKDSRQFNLFGSDQIVSFAFSYYYGSKEKDESSSDQVFLDKKLFVDGNLMVEFGIISESAKKDVQTTAIYRYYYCPINEKRLNVHVKHEMVEEATVQGIENVDGRFGSIISIKARSASIDSFNFGEIYPYLDFYGENNKIEHYQLNQNPATKDREWVISYKDDASLGGEAWLCYGQGKQGKANAVLFASNSGIVSSGTDERDGVQLKVAEKEYVNFLGTEVDYISINFGRHSYKPGYSHDITIPSDLIVQFDAEVFSSDTGGYTAVQKEAAIYQTLAKTRQLSGDVPFEKPQRRYNVTIIPRFGGIRFTHPWLSSQTGGTLPVMWIEMHQEGDLVAEGAANRSILFRGRRTFFDVLEGEYLVKIFLKRGNTTKIFTGSTVIDLVQNMKVTVLCTWERTITFMFLDQHEVGIPGIHVWLTNKEGIRYDENITQENGLVLLKAPFNFKDPYTVRAEYKGFVIYDDVLQKTIKKLNEQVNLDLYDLSVSVTDILGFPPGVELTPLLVTSEDNKTIQLTPEGYENGLYSFKNVPAGDYSLLINYGDFIDEIHVTVPDTSTIIEMDFSAMFDLTIDLFDSKGNGLADNTIEFVIFRDNRTVLRTKEKTVSLPPARYSIYAYMNNALIGVKQVDLTNDKHLTVVTTVESLFPVVLSMFFYALFGFFVILTLLKKFSLSSLLKCLAVLFIIMSFFQPWWLFTGSSTTVPMEKTTALYINPGMMIETTQYYGEISLNIAEMPDIFIMFLGAMLPVASLACFCLALGVVLKRIQKKNYALIVSVIGVILLCFLLSSFYFGTTKLAETSIGSVQGEAALTTSIGSEDILLQSSWGFSIGFYLVFVGILIAALSLILDIRARIMQKRKSLSLRS